MPPETESEALANRLLALTLNIAEAVRNGDDAGALVAVREQVLQALEGTQLTAHAHETLEEVAEWDRRIRRLASAEQTRLAASIQEAHNGRRIGTTYRATSRLHGVDRAG
mgnify:CR=1 FL=1